MEVNRLIMGKKYAKFSSFFNVSGMILIFLLFSNGNSLFSQDRVETAVPPAPPPTWSITHYGFVKTDYVYSSNAGLSYGREMLGAVNQAKRQLQADDTVSRGNIQLADSRYGMRMKFGDSTTGVFELDLMDFEKSSPNVNTRPRIRQAFLTHAFGGKWEIFAGQRWDIFAPLNPESYNVVSSSFGNGNLGWMREQLGVANKLSKDLTLTLAIGNGGVNVTQYPQNSQELNKTPTGAFQIKYSVNPTNTVYLSGITYSKQYVDPTLDSTAGKALIFDGSQNYYTLASQLGKTNRIRRDSQGISLSHEYKSADNKIRFRWEGTYGKNLGEINTLSIANGDQSTRARQFAASPYGVASLDGLGYSPTATSFSSGTLASYENSRTEVINIYERSGWLSFVYKILPDWELGFFAGATQVINKKDLIPAGTFSSFPEYTGMVANPSVTNFTTSTGAFNSGSIPGTLGGSWGAANMGKVRESSDVGYHITYMLGPVKIFFQHEFIRTFYQDTERRKGILAHISSINLETGAITLRNVPAPSLVASAEATTHVYRFGTMINF